MPERSPLQKNLGNGGSNCLSLDFDKEMEINGDNPPSQCLNYVDRITEE